MGADLQQLLLITACIFSAMVFNAMSWKVEVEFLLLIIGICAWRRNVSMKAKAELLKNRTGQRTARDLDYVPLNPIGCTPEVQPQRPKECWQPSIMPVRPAEFQAVGWEDQVKELLEQVRRTPASEETLARLGEVVKRAVVPVIPEAQIVVCANGNPARGKAYGMAVPDISVVLNVSHDALQKSIGECFMQGQARGRFAPRPDKLLKFSIRMCTNQLVAAGFKFRRSAFGSDEPKVILLVPALPELFNERISMEFYVNSNVPIRTEAIARNFSGVEPRVEELILLVRRWSRDRGIAHTAKGHLPPCAWNLLVVFFLQVGVESGPVVPAFSEEGFARQQKVSVDSVATLLKDFIRFYATDFNFEKEAVSVRLARRGPPQVAMQKRLVSEEGHPEFGPVIEDPFEASQNVAHTVTSRAMERLREEFQRAHHLCSANASLAEFLELWSPAMTQESGSA